MRGWEVRDIPFGTLKTKVATLSCYNENQLHLGKYLMSQLRYCMPSSRPDHAVSHVVVLHQMHKTRIGKAWSAWTLRKYVA